METDIYTLAHEIKNPLAIAKGYLEMSTEKNFLQYKELINNNIKEAIDILDNYLEYNKLSLDSDIIDILMLLEEIKNNFCSLFNIKVNVTCLYDELFIEADYHKLKQVFNNLIKNSVEAHCNNINIYVKMSENYLILTLFDDGDGFNNIDNLFGYSNKVNGNGIGLLITKKIIELHNGTIDYNNNETKGVNILIKLPIKL